MIFAPLVQHRQEKEGTTQHNEKNNNTSTTYV